MEDTNKEEFCNLVNSLIKDDKLDIYDVLTTNNIKKYATNILTYAENISIVDLSMDKLIKDMENFTKEEIIQFIEQYITENNDLQAGEFIMILFLKSNKIIPNEIQNIKNWCNIDIYTLLKNYINNDDEEESNNLLSELLDVCLETADKINFVLQAIILSSCKINEFYEILQILCFVILNDKNCLIHNITVYGFIDMIIEIEKLYNIDNENTLETKKYLHNKMLKNKSLKLFPEVHQIIGRCFRHKHAIVLSGN